MNIKTRKLIAGFMTASMIALAGCSPSPDVAQSQDDEEDNEPGIVTSSWDNESQQWNHYRSYRGQDYYFGSGTYPHTTTVLTSNPGIARSVEPVSVSKMTMGGYTVRGGIGGVGRASAAS